jgi:hypothetical protein
VRVPPLGSAQGIVPSVNEPFFVRLQWDDDAAVWVASPDDVPGWVTEAATLEALHTKLRSTVPELLEANGVPRQAGMPKHF